MVVGRVPYFSGVFWLVWSVWGGSLIVAFWMIFWLGPHGRLVYLIV